MQKQNYVSRPWPQPLADGGVSEQVRAISMTNNTLLRNPIDNFSGSEWMDVVMCVRRRLRANLNKIERKKNCSQMKNE